MVKSHSDDSASPRCIRCRYFLPEFQDLTSTISCPECGRRVVDVTDALPRLPLELLGLERVAVTIAGDNDLALLIDIDSHAILVDDITERSMPESIEKIQFTLNRAIACLHARADAIQRWLERGGSS